MMLNSGRWAQHIHMTDYRQPRRHSNSCPNALCWVAKTTMRAKQEHFWDELLSKRFYILIVHLPFALLSQNPSLLA